MTNIFFISDHHFFHRNILTFTDDAGEPVRPWDPDQLEEMHEFMIDQHNSVVTPQDHVWFGGDIAMGRFNSSDLNKILYRMNGHKRLLVGNHDSIKNIVSHSAFGKIELWRMFPKDDFVYTHVPIYLGCAEKEHSERRGKYHFNVHGHVHGNTLDDLRYINVSVEEINYRPLELLEIKQIIKERKEMMNV